MAKLNITFVNEVGNNLNRYKAIDVNTGDEYLFDLSRNGTITTPGTPLNAEIMNAIVQAINEQFSNLVVEINDTTPSNTKYPSEKAVVDYVGQIANEESVNVSDNVLIKISGVSDNLALPPESQMEVNSIEGNSIVRNQWISNIKFPSVESDFTNGVKVSAVDTTNLTITITVDTGGATEDRNFMLLSQYDLKLIASHKYLNIGCPAGGGADKYFFGISPNTQFGPDFGNGGILTNYTSGYSLRISISNGCPAGTYTFKPKFIDLTQWFGSNDNIPQDILNTPSNFFKHYKGSLAYDTGHIENGSGNLVDTNRNIWDEEYVATGYILDDGIVSSGYANRIASKNFIRIFPDTEYYFKVPYLIMDYGVRVAWYDNNMAFIRVTDYYPINNIITSPSNAAYMKFNVHHEYGSSTYNNDICINKSDTNFNGTYVSHIKNTLNLGNDILRSAGKARDKKIPDGTIDRKVGRVDLGTLDWNYGDAFATGAMVFYVILDESYKAYGETTIPNAICPKYRANNANSIAQQYNSDKTFSIFNGWGIPRLVIVDSSYTDATTFKAAMSGVYLNYELATPTTEQGTPYNNHLPVYCGGQEYLTGDVPFVINKNYDISIKDQVLTNVRVDKEQSEQIHALENVNREQSNAIDSLQNKVSNLETTQEAHSTSINSLNAKITDLENYKFDSSKLTIEQTLTKTTLKYNGTKISEIDSVDVSITPQIYIECTQTNDYNYTEKITVINNTSYDMYVSMVGQSTHNAFIVPFGETESSTKTDRLGAGGFPADYTAEIEIKIYYNPKTNYNSTIGYTDFKNVKTINLRATVHTTDR